MLLAERSSEIDVRGHRVALEIVPCQELIGPVMVLVLLMMSGWTGPNSNE